MIFDRIMGSETEFGVVSPGRSRAHETVMSALVVDSLPEQAADSAWDYRTESPLQDARGHAQPEESAHPTQLTHQNHVLTSEEIAQEIQAETPDLFNRAFWEQATMNRVLTNGARFYVDHAHPEYSAPETTHPWDAMVWDQAGDRIAVEAARAAGEKYAASWPEEILLYKNNTDNKSVSYGFHENYLIPRSVDFQRVARALMPFFASRAVVIGAGRAGVGSADVRPGFQISQRADFFERRIGLETTIRRPLVNTRDEPHAVREKYRRLHVIPGDANLSQTSSLLKYAMTAAVLALIEHGAAPELDLVDPVRAMQRISHDPTLRTEVELVDGRRMTGVQLQREYLDAARSFLEERGIDLSERDQQILEIWTEVIERLETDPLSLADRLDWVAKYALILGYERRGIGPESPKVQALDLQYADLRQDKGLYYKLVGMGRMRTLVSEEEIRRARTTPPEDTRAWLRGRLLARWPRQVIAAGWDVLALRHPDQETITRFRIDEPRENTRSTVDEAFSRAGNAYEAAVLLNLPRADKA